MEASANLYKKQKKKKKPSSVCEKDAATDAEHVVRINCRVCAVVLY